MAIQIHIRKKVRGGKTILTVESKDLVALLSYVHSEYDKQRTGLREKNGEYINKWIVQENPHLVGWIFKRYQMVLRQK